MQIEKELNNLNKNKIKELDKEKLKNYTKLKQLNKRILDEFISEICIGYYNSEISTRKIQIKWNV